MVLPMATTLTLAVDTSSRVGSLAVLRDTGIVGVVSTFSDEAYSSRMFRQLEFLLAELRVGLAEFDLFAVVSGPGSFTGLRVGLTAVKGWAEVYQRPIAAVSGLEAIASTARVKVGAIGSTIIGQFPGHFRPKIFASKSCIWLNFIGIA